MRNTLLAITLGGMVALGATSVLNAQDNTAGGQDQTQAQTQAQPQGRGPGRMDPARALEHLTRALDLSSDQQAQIKPILQDRQQKVQALWQNQSLSREDRRTQMQSIQQDTTTRIEAVLNDQQKQKYEAMQQRMRQRRQGGQAPANPPQPQ